MSAAGAMVIKPLPGSLAVGQIVKKSHNDLWLPNNYVGVKIVRFKASQSSPRQQFAVKRFINIFVDIVD